MSTIVDNREPVAGSPSGERPRPPADLVLAVAPGGVIAARGPALQLAGAARPVRLARLHRQRRRGPALDEAQLVVCVLPGA